MDTMTIEWFNGCIKEIKSFKKLRKRWDSYTAEVPNDLAYTYALAFAGALYHCKHDLPLPKVNPSVVGGIAFTFMRKNVECFVEFYNDGEMCTLATMRHGVGDRPTIDEYHAHDMDQEQFTTILKDIDEFLKGNK